MEQRSLVDKRTEDLNLSGGHDQSPPAKFGVSGGRRHKLSFVYNNEFAASVTALAATVVLITWTYVPDQWLHSIGICYCPGRNWASTVPTYVMVTIMAIGFYMGLNFMATPPPPSLKYMFDEYCKEQLSGIYSTNNDEEQIQPISDIGTNQMDDTDGTQVEVIELPYPQENLE